MIDNPDPFSLGEPCAQNKDGELLWDFETITKAVSDAIFAEREACAQVCEIVGEDGAGAAGEVWSDRCAAAIRARGQQ